MENAAKALAIAAAVIFTLLVLTLLVILYNQLSSYFQEKNKMTEIEQLQEFNARFENYNNKEIRGNELVSIMNNIVDYNNLQSNMLGYKPIGIKIFLGTHYEELQYGTEETGRNSGGNILIGGEEINNENGTNDEHIARIAGTSGRLSGGPLGITDIQLQKLSAQIDNIVDDEGQKANYIDEYKIYRAQILTRILGRKINATDDVRDIEQATYQYYQFTQFKRAMFKCKEITYDQKTGRVIGMDFDVILENGHIKFD